MGLLSLGTNSKLGKGIASYSRPVGPSCPPDCPFLVGTVPGGVPIPNKLRCYAEKIENRYTSVREKWSKESFGLSAHKWRKWTDVLTEEICKTGRKARAIRIHVGGDFLK